MIVIALGRWERSAGRWFVRERIYTHHGQWTPFCNIETRHKKDGRILYPTIKETKDFLRHNWGFWDCKCGAVVNPKDDCSCGQKRP